MGQSRRGADGSWQRVQQQIISQYKHLLNLSVALFDGTHSLAKRAGEQVAYQGRKKGKTSNTLWLTDANGLVVGFTLPVAGNHHHVADIEKRIDYLEEQLAFSGIRVDGLFINADAGHRGATLTVKPFGKSVTDWALNSMCLVTTGEPAK